MSKRRKASFRSLAFSGAILVLAAAGVLALVHRETAPVIPGDRSVAGLTDALARRLPPEAPRFEFRDVASEVGLDFHLFAAARSRVLPEDVAAGCAFVDFDDDGDQDVFLVNMEPLDPSKKRLGARRGHALFRNDAGKLTDVSQAARIDTPVHGVGVTVGDYDSDGRLDLYVTCYGPNQLFRNRGDGTFEDVAARAGVADLGFGTGAAFADYDGDGDLDLYVANYVQYRDDPAMRGRVISQYGYQIPFSINPSSYAAAPKVLYRNRGDGTFEDVTAEAGVANPTGKSFSVIFADLDGDTRPDLYVANDVSDNVFFHNQGGGKFVDASYSSRTADYRGAMGLGVGDFDGDLDLDIFITHWLAQENALYENLTEPNPKELGVTNPVYADVADHYGLGAIALDFVGWGTSFFDYDADGRLDLFVVNGNTMEDESDSSLLKPQRMMLFWNDHPRGYFELGALAGEPFRRALNGRGAAVADFDRDGDEDMLVQVVGGKPLLLRNESDHRHHWLEVALRSKTKNRFSVGGRIVVEAGGRSQLRVVGAQPSFLSASSLDVYFGLGAAARVEALTVRFPSGKEIVLRDVAADQRLVVEEEE